MEDGRTASALPCNMALASSFDRELAEEYGKVIAEECIENGIQIIWSPGINLMRTPMNGRNFEYMGEDPVLAGQIAAGYVRGCQSEGVAACPKHLALNNQEHCRTISDSRCDWNTIKELYLEAFRIVIEEASPWTIMSSYNKINGEFASQCGMLHHDFPSSSESCFFCALKRHKNCYAGKIMPSIAQSATEGGRVKTSYKVKGTKTVPQKSGACHIYSLKLQRMERVNEIFFPDLFSL